MTVQQLLVLCGSLLGLLLGLIGFFGRRMVAQFDASLKARADAEAAQQLQNQQLTNELKILTKENRYLRASLASLLKSFTAFDRWIYGEVQHGTFKTKPPAFSIVADVPAEDADAA